MRVHKDLKDCKQTEGGIKGELGGSEKALEQRIGRETVKGLPTSVTEIKRDADAEQQKMH